MKKINYLSTCHLVGCRGEFVSTPTLRRQSVDKHTLQQMSKECSLFLKNIQLQGRTLYWIQDGGRQSAPRFCQPLQLALNAPQPLLGGLAS